MTVLSQSHRTVHPHDAGAQSHGHYNHIVTVNVMLLPNDLSVDWPCVDKHNHQHVLCAMCNQFDNVK